MYRLIKVSGPQLMALSIALVALVGCGSFFGVDKPAVDCKQDVDCYLQFAVERISAIGADINYWSNWLTYALLASIIFGVVATVMIGLQGDENRYWTRPIGLIATTLGAAVTTLLTTFHVQDNIDKLIEIRSRTAILANNLERNVRGKNSDEINDLLWNYSTDFNKLMDERTKLKGSAGRLNIQPPVSGTPPTVISK